jgi:hypothetical protein
MIGDMTAPNLRDYMHKHGLDTPPPCKYCGEKASELDHVRPKTGPSRGKDPHRWANLQPACHRCNMRKGSRMPGAFRASLSRIAGLAGMPTAIKFYGEGARGEPLKRLRKILSSLTLWGGRLVEIKPGEPFSKPKTKEQLEHKAAKRELYRWRGKATFAGQQAAKALAAHAGYSPPTVERFIMGAGVTEDARIKLELAAKALHLDVRALRALKPNG